MPEINRATEGRLINGLMDAFSPVLKGALPRGEFIASTYVSRRNITSVTTFLDLVFKRGVDCAPDEANTKYLK